jgi:CTP:molybdopterin cytidylyltransferase MocA
MGTSKALLEVDGVSFLGRIITALREGGAGSVLVSVRDPEGPEGRETRTMGGIPVLNPDPGPGPISSLQTGLRTLPPDTPGVLFCPVDHPLFRPQTVEALIRTFRETSPPIVTPAFQGRRGHPVLFGCEVFPELMSEELPQGARTVVARYLDRRVVLDVQDPGILADINTPEDFHRHLSQSQP